MFSSGKKPKGRKETALASLCAAALMGTLIALVYYFNTPNPNMILITALVFFTGAAGLIPGAVSAVMMVIYSMFFFSTDHSFFLYEPLNLRKIWVVVLGVVLNFSCVGLLRWSMDKARCNLRTVNEELVAANSQLQLQAENARRIAELTQSMTSLLTHMPALTFSKDAEGRFLACNQMFAEYASRSTPEDVIGLTDFDMFDHETAAHFAADDQKALSQEEPYIYLEDVQDAMGNPRQLQTTKLRFTDSQGRLCVLGMCVDVTELARIKLESVRTKAAYEQARSESLTYSGIARALAADYDSLYYVDLTTDRYIELANRSIHEEVSIEQQGDDFFEASRRKAQTVLYPEDLPLFLSAFSRENILSSIERNGTFSILYRLMIDDTPNYVSMKGSRMESDNQHLIFGVSNVDAQIKDREAAEQAQKERAAYARLKALSGDLICIYTVDPVTDHYTEYSATLHYEELGIPKAGSDFFDESRQSAAHALYLDDVDLFLAMFSKEKILKEIEENGLFVLDYRLMIDSVPTYVSLKAAIVSEHGKPQLVVGVNNIDAQVKREQEYDYKLSEARNKANIDSLTGVKNKHAYVDIEAQLNRRLDAQLPVEFAIVVFDVNGLKQVNDTQGHQAGDELLRSACRSICSVFQHSPVFRIGGDEFTAVVQGQDYQNLDDLVLEIARRNVENTIKGGVVIACGMARFDNDQNVAAVFERADVRMYKNKRLLKEKK